jgi:tRNA 2-thiouridine synthesizing protein E
MDLLEHVVERNPYPICLYNNARIRKTLLKKIKTNLKNIIMEKIIAGKPVEVNEEGYLKNFSQWDHEVAHELAKEANLVLTPRHMKVIDYLQEQHKNEVPLTIRKVGGSGVVNIKEFYELFPNGPLKTSTKVAGIPKPSSCI